MLLYWKEQLDGLDTVGAVGLSAALLLLAQEGRTYKEFVAIGIGIVVIVGMTLRRAWQKRH